MSLPFLPKAGKPWPNEPPNTNCSIEAFHRISFTVELHRAIRCEVDPEAGNSTEEGHDLWQIIHDLTRIARWRGAFVELDYPPFVRPAHRGEGNLTWNGALGAKNRVRVEVRGVSGKLAIMRDIPSFLDRLFNLRLFNT